MYLGLGLSMSQREVDRRQEPPVGVTALRLATSSELLASSGLLRGRRTRGRDGMELFHR